MARMHCLANQGNIFLSGKSGTSEVIWFRDKDLFVQFLLIAQLQQVQHCCCTKTSSFFGIFPASRNHQSEWSWPSLKIQKVELAFNSCHWSLSQRYFWPVIWECLLDGDLRWNMVKEKIWSNALPSTWKTLPGIWSRWRKIAEGTSASASASESASASASASQPNFKFIHMFFIQL